MSARRYLRPPWMQRYIANRLVPLLRPALISRLSVRGRRTGRWHTVPVAVLNHEGERYLVSYRGESDWARNLRAALRGRLRWRGRVEEITVSEVPISERAALLEVYRTRYGTMPTVAGALRQLPAPGDHPVFRITNPRR